MLANSNNFPRTLVICEAPLTRSNGFGATLLTLFEGIPKQHIGVLYPSSPYSDVEVSDDGYAFQTPMSGFGVRGRKQLLYHFLGRSAAWGSRLSESWLRKHLGDWKPQVIYAFFYSDIVLDYAAWASRTLKLPFVAHAADDNPDSAVNAHRKSIFNNPRCCARIAICEAMAQEYRARFDCNFSVAHNGAPDSLLATARQRAINEGECVIRYLGTIHPAHYSDSNHASMLLIAQIVRAMVADGHKIRLEIIGGGKMTKESVADQIVGGPVSYLPGVDTDLGYALLRSANFLVMPFTFDSAGAQRSRLSFSTKLPEYLGSGVPTLVLGPAGNSTVAYCLKHGIGVPVSIDTQEAVRAVFEQSFINPQALLEKAARDQEHVRNNLSAAVLRERFQELIMSCFSKNG